MLICLLMVGVPLVASLSCLKAASVWSSPSPSAPAMSTLTIVEFHHKGMVYVSQDVPFYLCPYSITHCGKTEEQLRHRERHRVPCVSLTPSLKPFSPGSSSQICHLHHGHEGLL